MMFRKTLSLLLLAATYFAPATSAAKQEYKPVEDIFPLDTLFLLNLEDISQNTAKFLECPRIKEILAAQKQSLKKSIIAYNKFVENSEKKGTKANPENLNDIDLLLKEFICSYDSVGIAVFKFEDELLYCGWATYTKNFDSTLFLAKIEACVGYKTDFIKRAEHFFSAVNNLEDGKIIVAEDTDGITLLKVYGRIFIFLDKSSAERFLRYTKNADTKHFSENRALMICPNYNRKAFFYADKNDLSILKYWERIVTSLSRTGKILNIYPYKSFILTSTRNIGEPFYEYETITDKNIKFREGARGIRNYRAIYEKYLSANSISILPNDGTIFKSEGIDKNLFYNELSVALSELFRRKEESPTLSINNYSDKDMVNKFFEKMDKAADERSKLLPEIDRLFGRQQKNMELFMRYDQTVADNESSETAYGFVFDNAQNAEKFAAAMKDFLRAQKTNKEFHIYNKDNFVLASFDSKIFEDIMKSLKNGLSGDARERYERAVKLIPPNSKFTNFYLSKAEPKKIDMRSATYEKGKTSFNTQFELSYEPDCLCDVTTVKDNIIKCKSYCSYIPTIIISITNDFPKEEAKEAIKEEKKEPVCKPAETKRARKFRSYR